MIAVNDAYLWAPFADVCYFADSEWWGWHSKGIAKPRLGLTSEQVRERFASFAGQKCTIQSTGQSVDDPAVHMLRNRDYPSHGLGLSLDQERVVTGFNSGHQALNMAVLAGASIVILIGFDARETSGEPNEPTHWFGEHPIRPPVGVFDLYRKSFAEAAKVIPPGVRVINCSPGSAIDSFERMELAEALRLQPDPD